jgi:hypothetical protein
MNKETLVIRKFEIRVSANNKIESGYYIEARAFGILPKCHKSHLLSFTPIAGYVWTKALFSYNGEARISPKTWRELVARAPVVSDRLFPVVITAELQAMARADCVRYADSAERQLQDKEWTCEAHRQKCASGEIYTRVALQPVVTTELLAA